jgi:hypothetical protein
MQHVRTGGERDIGTIVHREQRAVALACPCEDFQRSELVTGRQRLVPQLQDVYPAGQCRVGELGEITALGPGVSAQVQLRSGQPGPDPYTVHAGTVSR